MSSSDYVRLESADGYTFVVARDVACASGMLKTSLDAESKWLTSTGTDEQRALENRVQESANLRKGTRENKRMYLMSDDRGVILMKVIEYLSYKVQYADFNAADIKDDFTDRIDPYIALEL
jgi:transcription elongation factor B subunit 1